MTAFDASAYGPVVAELLSGQRLAELGPGLPERQRYDALRQLTPQRLFAPRTVRDADMAAACQAALWLYFDFLDESHTISQGIDTVTGSFWHGMMHRREGDYDNAKYWFRRVGAHPVYEPLRAAAAEIATQEAAASGRCDPAAEFLATQPRWDAARFVDLCRRVVRDGCPCESLCRQVQLREWQLLFDYCYWGAVGQ